MKHAFLGFVLSVLPLSAFAGPTDCAGTAAPLVKNQFSTTALSTLVANGGVVRVFSSTRYYSTSNLSTIAKAGVTGAKRGRLILCVDDDYYSGGNLTTIAVAGGEVVVLN